MSDSQIVQLVKYYQAKIRDYTFDVFSGKLETDNVVIGETQNFLEYNLDEDFPRTELLVWRSNGEYREGTTSRKVVLTLQIAGYIYRNKDNMLEQDYYNIMNFGEELEKIAYLANDDRRSGFCPCDGFYHVKDNPLFYVEAEIGEQLATIIYQFEILLTK